MERLCDVLGRELAHRGDFDGRLWAVDGDLADSDGAHFFASRHPERFVMAGISEQCAVALAAGLATGGKYPFVFSFAAFLCCRAYDQIRTCVSQTGLPVVLIGSHAGGCTGKNGKSHTILNDLALMTTLPGLQVWAPSDGHDVRACLTALIERPSAAYVRLPREAIGDLPAPGGIVRELTSGRDALILSYGFGTSLALKTASLLDDLGCSATVVSCSRISPFPLDELRGYLSVFRHVYIIEDHYEHCGLASNLRAAIGNVTVRCYGWPADWCGKSGAVEDILRIGNLDPAHLASSILKDLQQ
jgi:transketolase